MKPFKGTIGEWKWTILDEKIGRGTQKMISIHQDGYNHKLDDRQPHTENEGKTSIAGIWGVEPEDIANAKLIVSAPEMLQLIREMDGFLSPSFEGEICDIKTGSIYHTRMKELINKILNSCSQ